MICENNRLKYCIDKKNHEILRVMETIKSSPGLGQNQILAMLDNIVDKAEDEADLRGQGSVNPQQQQQPGFVPPQFPGQPQFLGQQQFPRGRY